MRALFTNPSDYDAWVQRWRARLADEPQDALARTAAMKAANPAYIPRNHRIEAMIKAAIEQDDFAPFEELVALLSRPYDDQPDFLHLAMPPKPEERVLATFCGT